MPVALLPPAPSPHPLGTVAQPRLTPPCLSPAGVPVNCLSEVPSGPMLPCSSSPVGVHKNLLSTKQVFLSTTLVQPGVPGSLLPHPSPLPCGSRLRPFSHPAFPQSPRRRRPSVARAVLRRPRSGSPVPLRRCVNLLRPALQAPCPSSLEPLFTRTGPDVLRLPYLAFPASPRFRSLDVDPSIVCTGDALSFKLCGRGARVEVDLFAPSAALSFCEPYKFQAFDDLASLNCIYFHDPHMMPGVVALAATHKAFGLFVVPVLPGARPLIQPRRTKKFKLPAAVPWFDFLLKHSVFNCPLPPGCFVSASGGDYKPGCGMLLVAANFGINAVSRAKRARRPETSIPIVCVTGWPATRKLGPVPDMWVMPSPFSEEDVPVPDTFQAADAVVVDAGPPPVPALSHWDTSVFESVAVGYPYPRVLSLGLEAMRQELDPYRGNRELPKVPFEQRVMTARDSGLVRAKMLKEVEDGYMHGPREHPPFYNSFVIPFGQERKYKYVAADDPLSDEFRLTTDLSSTDHGGPSVNDLCTSPRWLYPDFDANSIRDMLAWTGPRSRVSVRDIPKCFRTLKVAAHLLFLFVYRVVTVEFGVEYFTDLCFPFGWGPSEWSWVACGAIIDWCLYVLGVRMQYRHVDNYFQFLGAVPDVDALAKSKHADVCFARLGVPLHEQEDAVASFTGSGWEWSTDCADGEWSMVMICPLDKYQAYSSWVSEWVRLPTLSEKQLEKAGGVLMYVATGLPAVRAYVSPLLHAKSALKQCRLRTGVVRKAAKAPVVQEALLACELFLSGWDRRCPIVAGFGPCFRAAFRGWVDGCTDMTEVDSVPCIGGCLYDESSGVMDAFIHVLTPAEVELSTRSVSLSVPYIETLGAVIWFELYGRRCRAARVLLAVDSDTAQQVLSAMFSVDPLLLGLARRYRELLARDFIVARVRSVVGDLFNRVADDLSHDRVQVATRRVWESFGQTLRVRRV